MADDRTSQFEKLYREHIDAVLAFALSRASREIATEVVESTFLVAWRRLDELPVMTQGWLIGVARRALAEHRRASGRREALGLRIHAVRAIDLVSGDPAEVVIERESTRAALETLGEGDRELLCLVGWDGLNIDEAAKVLGCSKAALKVRLHRARRRFESALTNEEAHDSETGHASVITPLLAAPPQLKRETI